MRKSRRRYSIYGLLIICFVSGWYDPLIQNAAYVSFAANAPGYGPLVNSTVLAALNASMFGPGGCAEQEAACIALGVLNETASASAPALLAPRVTTDTPARGSGKAWWLDVASPTWEDMRTIGKVSDMEPFSRSVLIFVGSCCIFTHLLWKIS